MSRRSLRSAGTLLRASARGALLSSLYLAACAGVTEDDDTTSSSSAVTVQTGVDYSRAPRPSPAGLHSAGYTFAVRYHSHDPAKNLTASEAQALQAAGLDVVSNWEVGQTDALKGRARGTSDAQEALRQATDAGMPAGRPIYFGIDFDATEGQQAVLNDYFDGVASVLGTARTGAYGGFYPLQRLFNAGKIAWGWQTTAWSGGQWEPRAQLRQVQNAVIIAGGQCDIDEAQQADFGQWHGGAGQLHEIFGDGSGWHDPSTTLAIPAGSVLSAVNMGGAWPVVMANENGVVYQMFGDASGWHNASTGISIPPGSPISAVNMGGSWPVVMTNENGVVYETSGDSTGWHHASTQIAIPAGSAISAVDMGAAWPAVMTNENGVVYEISGDSTGWHHASTTISIPAGSTISAVNMGGPWPVVMANENGVVYEIFGDSSGWHNASTTISIPPGSAIAAVNMGGSWPQVMANENGVVYQVSANGSGWHNDSTGLAVPAGSAMSAVNMGSAWPQVMVVE